MKRQLIRFACNSCGARLAVPAALAGRSDYCPKCQAVITAPLESEEIQTGRAVGTSARKTTAAEGAAPELQPDLFQGLRPSLLDDFLSAPIKGERVEKASEEQRSLESAEAVLPEPPQHAQPIVEERIADEPKAEPTQDSALENEQADPDAEEMLPDTLEPAAEPRSEPPADDDGSEEDMEDLPPVDEAPVPQPVPVPTVKKNFGESTILKRIVAPKEETPEVEEILAAPSWNPAPQEREDEALHVMGMGHVLEDHSTSSGLHATRHVVPSLGVGLIHLEDLPGRHRRRRRQLIFAALISILIVVDAAVWVFRQEIYMWWYKPHPVGTEAAVSHQTPLPSPTPATASTVPNVNKTEGPPKLEVPAVVARKDEMVASKEPKKATPTPTPSKDLAPKPEEKPAPEKAEPAVTDRKEPAPPPALAVVPLMDEPAKSFPSPPPSPAMADSNAGVSLLSQPSPGGAPAPIPLPESGGGPTILLIPPLPVPPPPPVTKTEEPEAAAPVMAPSTLVKAETTEPLLPPPPSSSPPPAPAPVVASNSVPSIPPTVEKMPEDSPPPGIPEAKPEGMAASKIVESGITAEARPALEVLKSFLGAANRQERLKYCQKQEVVRPLMEKHYKTRPDGPIPVSQIEMIEYYPNVSGGTPYCMFEVRGSSLKQPVLVLVDEPPKGPPRVDWEAFVEFKDRLLWEFLEKPGAPSQKFRVMVRRKHYFDKDVPDMDSKESFMLLQPGSDGEGHVFAPRESAPARQLAQQLGWGTTISAVVELAWRKEGSHRWVEIASVNGYGWKN